MPEPSGPDELARKRQAVAQLYETHFARVARYVAVRTGAAAEAEDLASEVFVRALRSVDSYKETGAPMEAWVFKIAHNIVVDHLRKKGRRPAPVALEEAGGLASEDDPAKEVELKGDVEELRAALAHLSEAQRQVLALRFGAGLKSEEAAQALGKNAGAVREMQRAALVKLRALLQKTQALGHPREPGRP